MNVSSWKEENPWSSIGMKHCIQRIKVERDLFLSNNMLSNDEYPSEESKCRIQIPKWTNIISNEELTYMDPIPWSRGEVNMSKLLKLSHVDEWIKSSHWGYCNPKFLNFHNQCTRIIVSFWRQEQILTMPTNNFNVSSIYELASITRSIYNTHKMKRGKKNIQTCLWTKNKWKYFSTKLQIQL